MDNSPLGPVNAWSPPIPGIVGIAFVGLLMGLASATLPADPPGRFLTGLAAVGLLVFAAGSWRGRPRLAITGDGLVYRGWLRTQTLRREDIAVIRITEFRRWARTVRLLEIDMTSGQLIVLSRWDLGGDPLDVLDALTEAGYAGR